MDGGVAFAGVTTRNEGVKVTGEIEFTGHPVLERLNSSPRIPNVRRNSRLPRRRRSMAGQ